MILACRGSGCDRGLSVSAIPGGNPSVQGPGGWLTDKFDKCGSCAKYFCDRCTDDKRDLFGRLHCPLCGGLLQPPDVDRLLAEQEAGRPDPVSNGRVARRRRAMELREEGVRRGRAGDVHGCLADLLESDELEPDNGDTWFNLGIAYRELGRYDGAAQAFSRLASLWPGSAVGHYESGVVFAKMRRLDAAVAAYDRAIGADPTDVRPYVNKAHNLRSLGRPEESLATLDQVGDLPDSHQFAFYFRANRGDTLISLGRYDEALADLDDALRLEPDDPETLCDRARALDGLGRTTEAADARARARALGRIC